MTEEAAPYLARHSKGDRTTMPPIEPGARETVLLAVTGVSPAVLTETIWALAQEREPVIPDRVVVVTTQRGRDEMIRTLFQENTGLGGLSPWQALRTELEHRGHHVGGRLRFGTTPHDVRVITATSPVDARSMELKDIRTPEDNEAVADFILEQVRGIVENPDSRLVASLAGGRKTMGALLYACMTMIGRDQDRLTHILVNEPYEVLKGFYFPGQPGPALEDREGGTHSPDAAVVELADVPFVALRNLFERDLGMRPGRFSNLVEMGRTTVRRRAAENLRLTVDCIRSELEVNGELLSLTPQECLLMLSLSQRAKQHEPAYGSYKEALDDLEVLRDRVREQALADGRTDWRTAESLVGEVDERWIIRPVSDLKRRLRHLGSDGRSLAACLPERGRCSLDLPGPMIHVIA